MQENKTLTRFPEGSIRELWSVSLPLMISSLASLLMIFVDRCFLARYSLDSLNAAVNSGTLAWAFLGGMGMLTVMSEVFVAQYNGAKRQKDIGVPVWQMIWISIFSVFIFVPLGLYIGPLLFKSAVYGNLQIKYFGYLMFFGSFYLLNTVFSGFYIGRGKTRFLIYLAIFANFINVMFDWILIFGVKGLVPAMGIKGAAIATCLGTSVQAAILGFMFFNKKNRVNFGTGRWKLNLKVLRSCFRVGFPPAVFYTLEIVGWAFFYLMMTKIGELHITISAICQSVVILLSFFFEGLNRGIAALAGNFIGSRRLELVHSLLKSALKLQVIFSVIVSLFLILDPKLVVDFLIPGTVENNLFLITGSSGFSFYAILKICLMCVFAYLFFQGIRWIFAGLLTAAGDTLFLLLAGSISVWIFLLLPVYFIVVKLSLAVQYAWMIAAVYSAILSVVYWLRFKTGRWKDIKLIHHETLEVAEVIETPEENIEEETTNS